MAHITTVLAGGLRVQCATIGVNYPRQFANLQVVCSVAYFTRSLMIGKLRMIDAERRITQVKSGKTSVKDVRDLRGVLDCKQAARVNSWVCSQTSATTFINYAIPS